MTADALSSYIIYDTYQYFNVGLTFRINPSASRSDDNFCSAVSAEQKYFYPSVAICPMSAVKILFFSYLINNFLLINEMYANE
jgi:hypothetical protein